MPSPSVVRRSPAPRLPPCVTLPGALAELAPAALEMGRGHISAQTALARRRSPARVGVNLECVLFEWSQQWDPSPQLYQAL